MEAHDAYSVWQCRCDLWVLVGAFRGQKRTNTDIAHTSTHARTHDIARARAHEPNIRARRPTRT
eukprot:6190535-Pleurochrysis_carterae.AAC.2